ncbi:MAG: alpha/beta fold hydrolase [Candidatus Binatia bacterium]
MTPPHFQHHYANLKDVRLHYVTLGQGKPVVLLHGWPQTWYEWRLVMPRVAVQFQLIAPDLRGLGDSSRPLNGYDKKTVADDIWQLMHDHLKHEKFAVVGHDAGAVVAFRFAVDHPEAVTHLVLLDVPVIGIETEKLGGLAPTGQLPRWHHLFHLVPDLPEALTFGRERLYLEWFFNWGTDQAGVFSDADINEYVRAYAQAGAMRAGFNMYRALPQDIADNHATLSTGFKLPMPTLGLGGGGSRGRGDLVVESLRRVATQVEGGSVPDCGHFIPEEKPQELVEQLHKFLVGE